MQDSPAVLPSVSAHDDARGAFDVARLLAPAQALAAFAAGATIGPCGIESVTLEDAAGRVLARPGVAHEDHPGHARSTMDGYALRSQDGLRPRTIVGEVRMGRPAPRDLGAGEAMRVPTGGALPAGADAVVPQEEVAFDGETVAPRELVASGAFVTQRADDIAAGERVLAAGRRIGAPELGVLATLGCAAVDVYRRPRVAIVSTGDELVDPQAQPGPGEVRDSNRYALAGAVAALGGIAVHYPRAADTLPALRAAVASALADCDALLLSGGSSVGTRDLVPRVVAELGPPGALVHGLRVKPGKPTLLGAVGPKPVIGLPGNPTSALMMFEAVARPIVHALTGERAEALPLLATARLPFVGRPGWTWFIPARLVARGTTLEAEPLVLRSAHTSLLARAAGYAVVGEAPARVEAGDALPIYRFSSGGAPVGVA